ncbi:bud emergence protein 1, partial [Cladochytrium tenue]
MRRIDTSSNNSPSSYFASRHPEQPADLSRSASKRGAPQPALARRPSEKAARPTDGPGGEGDAYDRRRLSSRPTRLPTPPPPNFRTPRAVNDRADDYFSQRPSEDFYASSVRRADPPASARPASPLRSPLRSVTSRRPSEDPYGPRTNNATTGPQSARPVSPLRAPPRSASSRKPSEDYQRSAAAASPKSARPASPLRSPLLQRSPSARRLGDDRRPSDERHAPPVAGPPPPLADLGRSRSTGGGLSRPTWARANNAAAARGAARTASPPPPSQGSSKTNPAAAGRGGDVLVPSTPRSSSHPKALFDQPPTRVVKAICDYRAQSVMELSFRTGDFFYVVSETDRYFEVTNPLEKKRGHVPKGCVESLDKVAQRINERARQAAMDPTGPPLRIQPPMKRGPSGPETAAAGPSPPNSVGSRSSPLSPQSQSAQAVGPLTPRQMVTSPTSTTPPVVSPTRSLSMGPPSRHVSPATVTAVTITNVELRSDNLQWFTIECHQQRDVGTPFVLFRTHDDFWALQVALLSLYPREAGRSESPNGDDDDDSDGVGRIVPFLPSPSRDMSLTATAQRRLQLEIYLQELVRACRVSRALGGSAVARRFFSVRGREKGDIDDATVRELGLGEMARLDERVVAAAGGRPGTVRVRVAVGRNEFSPVRVQDSIRFRRLLE